MASPVKKKKCPYCSFTSRWGPSISRHIRTKADKGDVKHKAHFARKVKVPKGQAPREPLSLDEGPAKGPEDRGSMSLSEPPPRGGEPGAGAGPGDGPDALSDDIAQLELPPSDEQAEYVAPLEPGEALIGEIADIPYENFESLFATAFEMSDAFASGELDSIKKLKKKDFELLAKYAARRRGSDLPDAYALAVVGAKFAAIVGWNIVLGVGKVLAKSKERKEKALKEKAEKAKADAERRAQGAAEGGASN